MTGSTYTGADGLSLVPIDYVKKSLNKADDIDVAKITKNTYIRYIVSFPIKQIVTKGGRIDLIFPSSNSPDFSVKANTCKSFAGTISDTSANAFTIDAIPFQSEDLPNGYDKRYDIDCELATVGGLSTYTITGFN